MSSFHICPLNKVLAVAEASGASHMATLVSGDHEVEFPSSIPPEKRLYLKFNDIPHEMEGLVPPSEAHIDALLDFVYKWDRKAPMLIHCWAGISRSTAGAYIAQCALNPDADVETLANTLRKVAPSATPNPRMIAMADDILSKGGKMVDSIAAIGRGAEAFEGTPFSIPAIVK